MLLLGGGLRDSGERFILLCFVSHLCGTFVLADMSALHSRVGFSPYVGNFVKPLSPVETFIVLYQYIFWGRRGSTFYLYDLEYLLFHLLFLKVDGG